MEQQPDPERQDTENLLCQTQEEQDASKGRLVCKAATLAAGVALVVLGVGALWETGPQSPSSPGAAGPEGPAAGRPLTQLGAGQLVSQMESFRRVTMGGVGRFEEPGGFSCAVRACSDVATGSPTVGNCPKETCKLHEEYADHEVGSHVADCARACASHPGCRSSVVQMQGSFTGASWSSSACFFLSGDCGRPQANNFGLWGVTCRATEEAAAARAPPRALGEWLPLYPLAKSGRYLLDLGPQESRRVEFSNSTVVDVKGELSGGRAAVSEELGALFRQAVQTSAQRTLEVELTPKLGEAYLWQWAFLYKGVRIKTKQTAITSGEWERPRCLPGFSQDPPRNQDCMAAKYQLKEL